MVNAFILNSMEVETATVNLKEMTYGILSGYMERTYNIDGEPKVLEEAKMAYYRKMRVDLGAGPK